MFRHALDWLFGRQNSRQKTRHSHFSRLHVDPLEDRRMLAVLAVDTNADNITADSDLTLREAIAVVNFGSTTGTISELGRALTAGEIAQIDETSEALGTNDTILFQDVTAPIELANLGSNLGQLDITRPVTIDGGDPNVLEIRAYDLTPGSTPVDGNSANDGDGGRIFDINAGSDSLVTLKGLTLTGGDTGMSSGSGGAIRVYATSLTLDNMVITGNSSFATSFATGGGGVFATLTEGVSLTVQDSVISGNFAQGKDGGGLFAYFSYGGEVFISNSVIEDNKAFGNGGGIAVDRRGTGLTSFTLRDSAVMGNNSGFQEFDHGVVSQVGRGGG